MVAQYQPAPGHHTHFLTIDVAHSRLVETRFSAHTHIVLQRIQRLCFALDHVRRLTIRPRHIHNKRPAVKRDERHAITPQEVNPPNKVRRRVTGCAEWFT